MQQQSEDDALHGLMSTPERMRQWDTQLGLLDDGGVGVPPGMDIENNNNSK